MYKSPPEQWKVFSIAQQMLLSSIILTSHPMYFAIVSYKVIKEDRTVLYIGEDQAVCTDSVTSQVWTMWTDFQKLLV